MNNKILCVATFVIGAAAGSLTTWLILKKKNEQKINQEVESVKESLESYYKNKYGLKPCEYVGQQSSDEVEETVEVTDEKVEEDEAVVDLKAEVKKAYNTYYSPVPDAIPVYGKHSSPHVIEPEDLGEDPDGFKVKIVTATYFPKDKILADDDGHILDIGETIGNEALNHFGDYEDDVVHVRNHQTHTDYEIYLDEYNKYSEVF